MLPIFAVIALTVFAIALSIQSRTTIPFSLELVEADIPSLSAPGRPNALVVFQQRTLCQPDQWTFQDNQLANVYRLQVPQEVINTNEPLVFFQKAAINNQFGLVIAKGNGCLEVKSAGRALPFEQRHINSMFPNVSIDDLALTTELFVILQDTKSRNLWLGIESEQQFQKESNQKWLFAGLYFGTLLVYAMAGTTVALWQKSQIAIAYAMYTLVIALWFLQNFGVGSAFISFWPSEEYFPYLQALFTGLIVIAVTSVCLLFLQPGLKLRRTLTLLCSIDVLLFFSSPFFTKGYELGALGLASLAIVVIVVILRGYSTRTVSERLFAIGLLSAVSIGMLQAVSVFTGTDFFGFAIFAFPVGNLVESTFWLLAIVNRMLHEFNRIQVRMLFDATHDPLTKLPNRTYLENRLKKIIEEEPASRKSLLFIDLDRFKQINDSMGHATGDSLLDLIANRLRALYPNADTIARFGGDEFCLLLDDVTTTEQGKKVGTSIIETIAEPILMVGREMRLSASVGVCTGITQYPTAEDVIRNADISVYAAKDNGRATTVVYSGDMHQAALEKFQIEQDILPGLRRHEFVTHFQPIVSLPGGNLAGFEALVRWNHQTEGWLPPYRFIQVAEDTGLIRVISEEVIQQVVDTIGHWKKERRWPAGAYVSINIAGQQMLDDSLPLLLQAHLNEGFVEAEDIRIEITESSLVTDFSRVSKTLNTLQQLGFKVLIDDFGTGYSSLKYLHELPIDVLKIDKTFVTGIEHNSDKRTLVKSIIAMAKALELDIVAEGVETEDHRTILSEFGCSKAQGYFYDKPKAAIDLVDRWLPPFTIPAQSD